MNDIEWLDVESPLLRPGTNVLVTVEFSLPNGDSVRDCEEAEYTRDRKWLLFQYGGAYVVDENSSEEILCWTYLPDPCRKL